ncbi:F510_1955 family glycosylhydrolase [Nonomuraea indica]|uniref:F510_1955 family glycosylhydrolase n=1 Tax=Nonomuraea indica TaxID=1581193 RepID=UPI0011841F12|nr:sialidase family protein [Nonomuraea indica]
MRALPARLRAAALSTGAAMLVTVAACGGQPHGVDGPDPGIGHVHGLGVDPSDGAVYLAGHYGLFKLKDGTTAERVAGRVQDHMGFTVAGPRTFLASGHPGESSPDAAPHLGLIRSDDAGRTWTTVSEAGTADFHALQLAGGVLYGFDSQSGRLRRSTDGGRTWAAGAEEQVIDLAANAALATSVYATTPQGLKVSGSGGTEFEEVAGAPRLTHIEQPAVDLLIGTGEDGRLHTSRDGGRTWQDGGTLPGRAVAFTAVDPRRLLAATEDGTVLESKDGGESFTVTFRPASG